MLNININDILTVEMNGAQITDAVASYYVGTNLSGEVAVMSVKLKNFDKWLRLDCMSNWERNDGVYTVVSINGLKVAEPETEIPGFEDLTEQLDALTIRK